MYYSHYDSDDDGCCHSNEKNSSQPKLGSSSVEIKMKEALLPERRNSE